VTIITFGERKTDCIGLALGAKPHDLIVPPALKNAKAARCCRPPQRAARFLAICVRSVSYGPGAKHANGSNGLGHCGKSPELMRLTASQVDSCDESTHFSHKGWHNTSGRAPLGLYDPK